jgi:predicted phosphoribosyltransferase
VAPFHDRRDAGRRLAEALDRYADRTDVIVLALPRGGVPVGYEIARRLGAPLDVFVVRKLGVPGHEEFAMGAIASGGVRILDQQLIRRLHLSERAIARVIEKEEAELVRRERHYRGDRPFPDLSDRIAILVDDGLATGATMMAAVHALREEARHVVIAVPVAARDTCEALGEIVDDIVCLVTPPNFRAVGEWYDDFSQTTDEEVHELLERARKELTHHRDSPAPA